MSRLRLYIDEDALEGDMVRGLRSHGVDVVTAADAGMIRRADEEQLQFACGEGRVLYSFNVRHFHQIHSAWVATGHAHSGIILSSSSATRLASKSGVCFG